MASRRSGVALVSHPAMREAAAHDTTLEDGAEHQESAERVRAVWDALRGAPSAAAEPERGARVAAAVADFVVDVPDLTPRESAAWLERAKLVHSASYLGALSRACSELRDGAVSPLTPRFLGKGRGGATRVSRRSFETALQACAVVGAAVELVATARVEDRAHVAPRHALCAVRPPGHHAGVSGPNAEVGGCGFCLVNAVAVAAAAHAAELHRASAAACAREPPRVAIVDVDVHHGNGTEECLRERFGQGGGGTFLYASVHLLETFEDPNLDFFPGTGHDAEDAARAGARKRPAPGGAGGRRDPDAVTVVNCPLTPLWVRRPKRGARRGRAGFRAAVSDRVLPALRGFAPDLVLVSLGVDGALGDVGNTNEAGDPGLDLQPEDFRFVGSELARLGAPVVAALEGGYGRFDEGRGFDRSSVVGCVAAFVEGLQQSGSAGVGSAAAARGAADARDGES